MYFPIACLTPLFLAALRSGIKDVIIPKDNEKDLRDMPKVILDKIKIHPVKFVDEVFTLALKTKPIKSKTKQKKTITSKSKKVDIPKNLQ